MSSAKHISDEPQPTGASDPGRFSWSAGEGTALPRAKPLPAVPLQSVLRARTSLPGPLAPTQQQLVDILWHANFVRERNPPSEGRRGWESRTVPSAGGLHGLEILLIPADPGDQSGWYDPIYHQLIPVRNAEEIGADNRLNVAALCGAATGTTLQFVCDIRRLGTLYHNPETLLWRDVGSLIATLAIVASALDACATPLGRISLESHAFLPDGDAARWTPAGALLLTANTKD